MPKTNNPRARTILEAPSHELVRSLLDYDPITGIFTWTSNASKGRVGKVAGSNHGDGYQVICIRSVRFLAHRLAWFWMTGVWPKAQIDHKDRNSRNNAWANLREATNSQNTFNAEKKRGKWPRGVQKLGKRYRAAAWIGGKTKYLGTFKTPQEAHQAWLSEAMRSHGEFFNDNHRDES